MSVEARKYLFIAILFAVALAIGVAGSPTQLARQIAETYNAAARCVPHFGETGLTEDCIAEIFIDPPQARRRYEFLPIPPEDEAEFNEKCEIGSPNLPPPECYEFLARYERPID